MKENEKLALGKLLVDYKVQQQLTELDTKPSTEEIMTMAGAYNVEGESNFIIYVPSEEVDNVVDNLTGLATDVSMQKVQGNTTIVSVDVKRVRDITTLSNMLDGLSSYSLSIPADDKLFVALVNGSEIDNIMKMKRPA